MVERGDENAILSFRNLTEVQLIEVGELNAYDVLCNDWIVFTKATLPGEHDDDRRRGDAQAEGEEAGCRSGAG